MPTNCETCLHWFPTQPRKPVGDSYEGTCSALSQHPFWLPRATALTLACEGSYCFSWEPACGTLREVSPLPTTY